MPLKPQDIMVVLKFCTYERRKRPPMSVIAADLNMSPSEIHAAIKRLQKARGSCMARRCKKNRTSQLSKNSLILHGVKYATSRGTWTSDARIVNFMLAAPPLKDEIASGDELPPVWPWQDGETRGIALEPLYKTTYSVAFVTRFSTNCSPWSTRSGIDVHASEKSQKNT